MKFSYSPWLAALTVATTTAATAAANLVNVSPATAASMKFSVDIHDIEVNADILGDSPTTIDAVAGSFTTNDSMDVIESVSLELGDLIFDQGEFESNGSQILFSNSAQQTQSLTLFNILPLPQEIGGTRSGDALLVNGDLDADVPYQLTKLPSVPEPLTLLGSAAALGFGVGLKQEHSRKKNKVNE
ncbi:PEP-CTERM sorting domain-containing protein [Coleofasciculus sp. E2-BRE-01]|uniref:PEP-CTERM sorting domain-containing protein n=1 Tax=Coleofasciculus sp. E2-BRE-01 TaxID=3069524 RepID=UPI0032FACD15